MSDFYRAFEDRYRGSREDILSRLRPYVAFLEPLKARRDGCTAVDLGCGRGEWLELLRETGIAGRGVDIDPGMLAGCTELGLAVEAGEGVGFLRGLPEGSEDLVSAFHVAEHIPFAELQALVQEALRVLKPGGLLILETPNPENLRVGADKFYIDPSHHRPIPPPLLSFLPEHYGFRRTKVLRLQEQPGMDSNVAPSLLNVLGDASPDYAVVAQKDGPAEELAHFDAAFGREYGVTLESLAARYDSHAEERVRQMEARVGQAEASAREAQGAAREAEAHARQAEARARQAESTAQHAESHVRQLLASKSWRFTAPLRSIVDNLARIFGANK